MRLPCYPIITLTFPDFWSFRLVLPIPWRAGVIAGRNGVLAAYLAVTTHGGKFAATLIPEHLPGSLFRLLLSMMQA